MTSSPRSADRSGKSAVHSRYKRYKTDLRETGPARARVQIPWLWTATGAQLTLCDCTEPTRRNLTPRQYARKQGVSLRLERSFNQSHPRKQAYRRRPPRPAGSAASGASKGPFFLPKTAQELRFPVFRGMGRPQLTEIIGCLPRLEFYGRARAPPVPARNRTA